MRTVEVSVFNQMYVCAHVCGHFFVFSDVCVRACMLALLLYFD